jgi:hypothetical protein
MRVLKRIVLLLMILIVLLFIGWVGFVYVLSSAFSGGLGFIPQDCILLERDISGHIQDSKEMPIKNVSIYIQAGLGKGFEAGKVDLSLKSDQDGHFQANGVWVFACDILTFQIAANGYAEKRVLFTAAQENSADPDYYGSPQDATSSTTGQIPVLPREITIQLP